MGAKALKSCAPGTQRFGPLARTRTSYVPPDTRLGPLQLLRLRPRPLSLEQSALSTSRILRWSLRVRPKRSLWLSLPRAPMLLLLLLLLQPKAALQCLLLVEETRDETPPDRCREHTKNAIYAAADTAMAADAGITPIGPWPFRIYDTHSSESSSGKARTFENCSYTPPDN